MPQPRHEKILPQGQAESACRRHHEPMSAPPAESHFAPQRLAMVMAAGGVCRVVIELVVGDQSLVGRVGNCVERRFVSPHDDDFQ